MKKFTALILKKHEINYWECISCGSLQTDTPFWLSEAYAHGNLTYLDVGAVQRNINNFSIISLLSRLIDVKNILDHGGGDGMLCRSLRDIGLNVYVSDKYASLTYAKGFDNPNFSCPELSLAFEVFEHFVNPEIDIDHVFEKCPDFLLVSTVLYGGQDSEWWYLSKETGQHIFFYTRRAMQVIAQKYGYQVLFSSDYVFFYKSLDFFRRKLIKKILSVKLRRLVRLWAIDTPVIGLDRDYKYLIDHFKYEKNT